MLRIRDYSKGEKVNHNSCKPNAIKGFMLKEYEIRRLKNERMKNQRRVTLSSQGLIIWHIIHIIITSNIHILIWS
jgi:hypothetical protein